MMPSLDLESSLRDREVFREVFNEKARRVNERFFEGSRRAATTTKRMQYSSNHSEGLKGAVTGRRQMMRRGNRCNGAKSMESTGVTKHAMSDNVSVLSHDPSVTYHMPPEDSDDEDDQHAHPHEELNHHDTLNNTRQKRTNRKPIVPTTLAPPKRSSRPVSQWDKLMSRYKRQDAKKAQLLNETQVKREKQQRGERDLTMTQRHKEQDTSLERLMEGFDSSDEDQQREHRRHYLDHEEEYFSKAPTPRPTSAVSHRKHTHRPASTTRKSKHSHVQSTSHSVYSTKHSTTPAPPKSITSQPHSHPAPKDRFSLHKSKHVTLHSEAHVSSPGTIQACNQGRFAFSQLIVHQQQQRLYLFGGMKLIGKKLFKNIVLPSDSDELSAPLANNDEQTDYHPTDLANQFHNRVLTNSLLMFTPSSLKVRHSTAVDEQCEWSWLTNGGKWEEICFHNTIHSGSSKHDKQHHHNTVTPSPRAFHSIVEFDNKLYVYGGESIRNYSYHSKTQTRDQLVRKKQTMIACSDFFVFNLKTRKWSVLQEDLRTIAQREEEERALLQVGERALVTHASVPPRRAHGLDDLPATQTGSVLNIQESIQKKVWKDQDLEIYDLSPLPVRSQHALHGADSSSPYGVRSHHHTERSNSQHPDTVNTESPVSTTTHSEIQNSTTSNTRLHPHDRGYQASRDSRLSSIIPPSTTEPTLDSPSSRNSSHSSSTFSHNTTVITKSTTEYATTTTHNTASHHSSSKNASDFTPFYRQELSVKLPAVSTTFSESIEELGEDDATTLTEGEVSSASFVTHSAESGDLPDEYRAMAPASQSSHTSSTSSLDDTENVSFTDNSLYSSLYKDMGYSSPAFDRLSSTIDDDQASLASVTLSQERRLLKQRERSHAVPVAREVVEPASHSQTSMVESYGETQTQPDDDGETYNEEDDETCTTEVTTTTTSMLSHIGKAQPMEVDLSDIDMEESVVRSECHTGRDALHVSVDEGLQYHHSEMDRKHTTTATVSGQYHFHHNGHMPASLPQESTAASSSSPIRRTTASHLNPPSTAQQGNSSSFLSQSGNFNHDSLMASYATSTAMQSAVHSANQQQRYPASSPRSPPLRSNHLSTTGLNTHDDDDIEHALSYSNMRPPPLSRHTSLIYYRKLYPGQKTYVNRNSTNLVIYGGKNHKGEASGDVWIYNFHSEKFLKRMGPPPRHSHSACFDSEKDRMIIFGGVSASNTLLGDAWVHRFDNDTNRPVHFQVGPKPKPRAGHGATFSNNQLFIFSGYDGKRHLSDCWVFNMNTCKWKEIYYSDPIPARYFHNVQMLDERHAILLGGLNAKRIPLKIPYCMTLPESDHENEDEDMGDGVVEYEVDQDVDEETLVLLGHESDDSESTMF